MGSDGTTYVGGAVVSNGYTCLHTQVRRLSRPVRHTAIETGHKAESWKQEREEHRGWSKLVIRAWRDAAKGQARKLRLDKLAAGEARAKADSVRTKRRAILTVAEGRGGTRRIRRIGTETWWARLRQKICALATWARLVRCVCVCVEKQGNGMSMGKGEG